MKMYLYGLYVCLLDFVLGQDDYMYERIIHHPLQRLWGIPDTTAQIGRLFSFQIPKGAFDGKISRYKAFIDKSDYLPSWLLFNEKLGIFEGVPKEEDLGEHYITVKAFDQDLHDSVKDVFALEVLKKSSSRFPLSKTDCDPLDEQIFLELILDINYNDLSPRDRVHILKKFGDFFNVDVGSLHLSHHQEKNELFYDSVLMAGPGDIKNKMSTKSTVIKKQIGCIASKVKSYLTMVENMKLAAKDGTLSNILKYPVVGWKLSKEESDYRKRREIYSKTYVDMIDEPLDSIPESRAVLLDPKTPLFPLEPSPVIEIHTPSYTHRRRRHHRGERNIGKVDDNTLSMLGAVLATPTYPPNWPPSFSVEIESTSVYPHEIEFTNSLFTEPTETEETEVDSPLPFISTSENINMPDESTPPLSNVTGTDFPDEITREFKNLPPAISQRLQKQSITAGKAKIIQIPENIFVDLEDGNTRHLKIELLTAEGNELSEDSWLQLDVDKLQIYALPLEEQVSRWSFILKATDSEGLSISDTIEIVVQHHKAKRTVNHSFSAEILSVPPMASLKWQLDLLDRIKDKFNNADTDQITVLERSIKPPLFTWTNDSLSRLECPKEDIEEIFNKLTDEDGLANKSFKGLEIGQITWTGSGHCKKEPEIPPPAGNFPPTPRNPVDFLNATVGQLLIYPVPADTFYDPEDGNTRNLKLSLVNHDRHPISPNHWLQFDVKNQEFYGIPLAAHIGQMEYQLICEDKGGLSVSDGLVVIVLPAPRVMYNVDFSMRLALDYSVFLGNPTLQRSFVQKLALIFGDTNTTSIVLSGFSPGSIEITWHNKSLPTNICPDDEILKLRQILLGDDEKVKADVLEIMSPEFIVVKAKLTPTGICQGALTEISPDSTENERIPIVSTGDQYIIGLVVPAVVITIMLMCAGLVACILYRRRRTGKMSVGDEDERQTFRSKGIPVIFQDELDERPEPTNKSPVIMKEEKPPLPPPEYQRGQPMATTALLSDTEDSPYQPPPPFTTSRDSSRPKPTPTYRKPPPYVPP